MPNGRAVTHAEIRGTYGQISGIGENKLRELINAGKIEFVQTGNKKLLVDSAIWDWYNREKTIAKEDEPCLSE